MSNENKSIHEFDFNLICKYFSSPDRQGPGNSEVTLKVWLCILYRKEEMSKEKSIYQ